MKAIILQSRPVAGGAWSTVNRYVGLNAEVNSAVESDQQRRRRDLRDKAATDAVAYGQDMLPRREFRVVELDHVFNPAPAL